jgi:hypothetical protein
MGKLGISFGYAVMTVIRININRLTMMMDDGMAVVRVIVMVPAVVRVIVMVPALAAWVDYATWSR